MDYVTIVAIVVAVATAASTGAMFQPGAWYDGLDKPRWTPPRWAFPVAWTLLYVLIAWAAVRVAFSGSAWSVPALAVFAAQVALNAVWSPVFFGLRNLGLAFRMLVGLWLSVAAMLVLFALADGWAGAMMVPYLLWVTVAGALNFSVWRRNPLEDGRAAPA